MLSTPIYHHPRQNLLSKLVSLPIELPIIKYGFVALLFLLTFPYLDFVQVPSPGIDNSWRIALELLHQKNLVWGQDIIFTYGPLGRWLQRYIIGTNPVELLLVDTFFAINVACLLYSFLPNPLKIWHLFVYSFIWAVVNSMCGEWIHFTWFYILIYWGIRIIHQPAPDFRLTGYLIIVCTINFFMKVNFGIIALGFMISLLSFLFLNKRISLPKYSMLLGFLGFLLIIGAFWLHTDLIQYVISSVYIIDGYNESQAVFPENKLRIVLLSYGSFFLQILAVILYLIYNISFTRKPGIQQANTLFTLFWTLFLSFIVLKYAFTRADDGHITAFIKQSSLLLLLVVVWVRDEWLRKNFFILLFLNCGFYLLFYAPIYGKVPVNYATIFSQKLHFISHYLQKTATENYPEPEPTFPASIRQKISHQTTDVIPCDVSEVYFNGLNYNPRPTLQSYQSYNGYLDRKNREKYLSASAPEWLIYRYDAIDGKYPLADETQTFLAILQRYRVIDQTRRYLFLKRQEQTRPLKMIRQKTVQLRMDEKLRLAGSDSLLHVLYAKPCYTVYGKLLNLFFQPPQLIMRLCAENNTTLSYRAVPKLLEKGLLINSRVDNLADANEFLATHRVKNKRLTELCFHQTVRLAPGFDPMIEITIYSYQITF